MSMPTFTPNDAAEAFRVANLPRGYAVRFTVDRQKPTGITVYRLYVPLVGYDTDQGEDPGLSSDLRDAIDVATQTAHDSGYQKHGWLRFRLKRHLYVWGRPYSEPRDLGTVSIDERRYKPVRYAGDDWTCAR